MKRLLPLILLTCTLWAQNPLSQQIPMGNNKANKLYEEGNLEEALKSYLDLYGQETDNGALAYNLGNTYAALGDMEKASEFYNKAVKSTHAEARRRSHFNLGNMQMGAQKPQEAIKEYERYLRQAPNDTDAKRNLELALRMLEQQQQQQDQNQDQDQENQDQENQDQQQQQQQQQSSDDQNESEQEQGGESKGEQDKEEDQQDQQQNQDSKDQQNQASQQQQDQNQQNQSDQEKQEQQQQNNANESPQDSLNEEMKEQILKALSEQELKQQKEFQKRMMGTPKRRAKDW